jgi:hypothetical protein
MSSFFMDFIMLHDAWLANPERHTGVTWVLCSRHNHCCVPTLNNNVRRQIIDLAGREPGQRGIDIDINRSEFSQFQLQDLQIPPGIECDLVVGDPERPLLGLREALIARAA